MRFLQFPPISLKAMVNIVVQVVALSFGAAIHHILGRSQKECFVLPRQVAMWLLREVLQLGPVKIARIFRRSHSTVSYSLALIDRRIRSITKENRHLRHTLFFLIGKCNELILEAQYHPT